MTHADEMLRSRTMIQLHARNLWLHFQRALWVWVK